MAILQPPKIDNVELTLDKDVANANFKVEFDINWSAFDQATNLPYTEVVKLVGSDPNRQQDLFTGPILAKGSAPAAQRPPIASTPETGTSSRSSGTRSTRIREQPTRSWQWSRSRLGYRFP